MKKFLVGLFLISSCLVDASDASSLVKSCCEVGGAVLVGVVGTKLYQASVEEKPEDTLLIGTESYEMRSCCSSSTVPARYDHYKGYRAGVGLAGYFVGYKTDEYDAYSKKSKNIISQNDWNALATGAATGIATYALMKYLDKK